MDFVKISMFSFGMLIFLNINQANAAVMPQASLNLNANPYECTGAECRAVFNHMFSEGNDGSALLIDALRRVDKDLIEEFVNTNGVNWKNKYGQSIMHLAAMSGSYNSIVFAYVILECPIVTYDEYGNIPLDYASGETFKFLMNLHMAMFFDDKWNGKRLTKDQLALIACQHLYASPILTLTNPPYNVRITKDMLNAVDNPVLAELNGVSESDRVEIAGYLNRKYREQSGRLCSLLGMFCGDI